MYLVRIFFFDDLVKCLTSIIYKWRYKCRRHSWFLLLQNNSVVSSVLLYFTADFFNVSHGEKYFVLVCIDTASIAVTALTVY